MFGSGLLCRQFSPCILNSSFAAAPGMPSQTSLLRANTLVSIRPRRPPVNETVNEGFDFFHSVILSPTPLPLPDSTMKQFTAAKAAVGDHVKSGLLVARPGDDVIVTTLGTGSAVPSKYRNGTPSYFQTSLINTRPTLHSIWNVRPDPKMGQHPSGCRGGHLGSTRPAIWGRRLAGFERP